MKKLLNTAFIYALAAMAGGVFYREFTKFNGFSGRTALGLVHTHLFLLAHREKDAPPSLVVAPTSLMYNWLDEIERFAPELKAQAAKTKHPASESFGVF